MVTWNHLAIWAAAFGMLGCASLPAMPPGLTVRALGSVDGGRLLAWRSQAGSVICETNGRLLRVDSVTGERRGFGADQGLGRVERAAWSPDGARLALATAQAGGHRLVLLDRGGRKRASVGLTTPVWRLGWASEGRVLALGRDLRTFSFGAASKTRLVTWRGTSDVNTELIWETGLARGVLPLLSAPAASVSLAVSPYGDAVAFTRLHSPPARHAYREVVVRHLASGAERVVGLAALASSSVLFSADGRSVVYSDDAGELRAHRIWSDRRSVGLTSRAEGLARSPGGRLWVADGLLLDWPRPSVAPPDVVVRFEAGAQALFSHDGRRLLVLTAGQLWRVDGLTDAPRRSVDTSRHVMKMRRWRAEGLISSADFERLVGGAQ